MSGNDVLHGLNLDTAEAGLPMRGDEGVSLPPVGAAPVVPDGFWYANAMTIRRLITTKAMTFHQAIFYLCGLALSGTPFLGKLKNSRY
jgi:hypothetical protein